MRPSVRGDGRADHMGERVLGLIALPNRNNVVFARRKRIQQIGGHLESDADFGSVPRLVVARMKPAADAAMT